MSYLGAAVSVARGQGLRIPTAAWNSPDSTSQLKAFPPGYSMVLAPGIRLGAPPLTAARVVQAVAAGITVTLTATLALSLAGPWAAALAAGLVLLTPALVEDHLSVLSEPLYLMLLMGFLVLLLRRPDRPLWYGTVAALATAVRYLGGALGGVAVVWALLQGGTLRERLRRAGVALAPMALLSVVWILAVRGQAGRPPAASLVADFSLAPALADLRDALVDWLAPAPPESAWVIGVALLTGLLVGLLLFVAARRIDWRSRPTQTLPALWLALALVIGAHLTVLLFARIFVGHEIPFDGRLLSPLMLGLDLVVAVSLVVSWPGWRWPARSLAAVVLLAWTAGALARLQDLVQDARSNGWDYNTYAWRRSATVAWARTAGGHALFSNHPVPLWFHAGRHSRDLPQSLDPDTLAAFARTFDERHGVVVVFADTSWQPGVPVDSLVARVPLKLVAKFEDGAIYQRPLAVGH